MSHTFTLQSGSVVVIDDLVKAARDALADGQVTFGEVVQLGGLLASKVNRFGQLSGPEKQKVVVAAVEKGLELVLDEKLKSLPEAEREAFEKKVKTAVEFAKETLPAVIDVAVSAANGKLDLGRAKKSCLQALLLVLRCVAEQKPGLPLLAEATKAVEQQVKADKVPAVETTQVDVAVDSQDKPKTEESEASKAPEESQKEAPSATQ